VPGKTPEVQQVLLSVITPLLNVQGCISAVSASKRHSFSKQPQEAIRLIAGFGVEGDAHAGSTTQHQWLVRTDPLRPNLTQVHLMHTELYPELATRGFAIAPGELGENIVTSGIDLLSLPVATKLHLGSDAIVEVTGLRDPCSQLNKLRPGLMKALIGRDAAGGVVRKAGIMAIVVVSGEVRPGDCIRLEQPPQPWKTMGPV
jgi:MOSC domain-containing protein YiiM